MKPSAYLRQRAGAPVKLNDWVKTMAALTSLVAIFSTVVISQFTFGHAPLLLASMGASAVILFVVYSSPLAQPWSFLGGHMLSGLVGVLVAFYVQDPALASALAVSLSVLAMLTGRCLHPPGAATALVPVLNATHAATPDFAFLLAPLGLNVVSMLFFTLIINRIVLRRPYPASIHLSVAERDSRLVPDTLNGISPADIEQATKDFKQFIDVGVDDLSQIFTRLQLLHFEKQQGSISCGEIMQTSIPTAEYATEVESAWIMMHEQNLKVLPVLDKARRVIGIVTRYDFLKNLKMTPYDSFEDKWLAFIKRSSSTSTDKPEAIGHIMTRKVKTLPATAHIAELIPLVVREGHHHVPIVDHEDRFVGLVFQNNLIAALFNQQLLNQSVMSEQQNSAS
jgi:CBS domain-containing membrane protein